MFKKVAVAGLLAVLFSGALADTVSCRVVGVTDGDTLSCLTEGRENLKVRLYGIDAPESRQDFGTQSKKHLSNMVFGKQVTLDVRDTDRYGRTVADVLINDKSVNLRQVETGHAWAYRQYLNNFDFNGYTSAEDKAKRASLGLWSSPNPINPADFRKGVKRGSFKEQLTGKPEKHGNWSCGEKHYCKEMRSCSEAKYHLNVCGLSRLDRDGDGVPCESICH